MTAEANRKLLMRRVDLANSETGQDILIEQARSDRAAFARLYRMHYERMFRYCCRRLFNRHDAEEVTSTVFFRVMRTISIFEGNSDGFRIWLYRIATNAVNDHLKTAKRRAETIRNAAQERGRGHAFATESDKELQKYLFSASNAVFEAENEAFR
jgi:RNA polymerase sigma factor (sigma-70 family)